MNSPLSTPHIGTYYTTNGYVVDCFHVYWNRRSIQRLTQTEAIDNATRLQHSMLFHTISYMEQYGFIRCFHVVSMNRVCFMVRCYQKHGIKKVPIILGTLSSEMSTIACKLVTTRKRMTHASGF